MPRKRKRPALVTPTASKDALTAARRASCTSLPSRCEAPPAPLQEYRFHRAVERLHELGPRPLGEILAELVVKWGAPFAADLNERLNRYNRDPETVRALGADRGPRPPLREVPR